MQFRCYHVPFTYLYSDGCFVVVGRDEISVFDYYTDYCCCKVTSYNWSGWLLDCGKKTTLSTSGEKPARVIVNILHETINECVERLGECDMCSNCYFVYQWTIGDVAYHMLEESYLHCSQVFTLHIFWQAGQEYCYFQS